MRIPIALLLLAVSRIACAAVEADRTAWQWQAPVVVGQAGLVRMELTPPVLDARQHGLQDIRV